MIDNVKFMVRGFDVLEWGILKSKINVISQKENKIMAEYFNLRFIYYPLSEELWVNNSLHKFYNACVREIPKGIVNYDDFTFDNLTETIHYLCNFINRNENDCELFGEFEYGVNLNIAPHPIHLIQSCYLSYKSKTSENVFEAMLPKKGKIIGRSAHLTDYTVKVYNKSAQPESMCPTKFVQRFEIKNSGIGRLKNLLNLKRVTLADLLEQETWGHLANDLIDVYDKIIKIPFGLNDIKRSDMLEIVGYSQPIMKYFDKRLMTPYEYNESRRKTRMMIEKYANFPENAHNQIRTKLENKLTFLINS